MPNPLQNQGPQQPRQNPNQEPEYESQSQERSLAIRDDKVIVETDAETVLTPEQTVQRYNNLATQLIQIQKSIDAYTEKIESELDEHNFELTLLHVLVDEHSQSMEDFDPNLDELENSLSSVDIDRFNKIQEMHSQIEDMKENVEDGLEDVDELYPYARKMADNHDLEVEYQPEEIYEELGRETPE